MEQPLTAKVHAESKKGGLQGCTALLRSSPSPAPSAPIRSGSAAEQYHVTLSLVWCCASSQSAAAPAYYCRAACHPCAAAASQLGGGARNGLIALGRRHVARPDELVAAVQGPPREVGRGLLRKRRPAALLAQHKLERHAVCGQRRAAVGCGQSVRQAGLPHVLPIKLLLAGQKACTRLPWCTRSAACDAAAPAAMPSPLHSHLRVLSCSKSARWLQYLRCRRHTTSGAEFQRWPHRVVSNRASHVYRQWGSATPRPPPGLSMSCEAVQG